MTHNDRALVQAVLDGERGAFERLVGDYQRLCWHIVNRMVRNPDDARDLSQETFIRVHQQLGRFRFECPLKSWIGRIAYSIALRHLERQRHHLFDDTAIEEIEDLVADTENAQSRLEDAELVTRLRAAIDALPPVPRTLLTLFHLEELSISEIAEVTEMSEGTIKSHLFRARLKLRDWLTRHGVVET